MVGRGLEAIEVAMTVMEVAEVAWSAIEHRQTHDNHTETAAAEHRAESTTSVDWELEALRSENQRLKALLQENLKLLQDLSQSLQPPQAKDCPPHLHAHLVETVGSENFLSKLKSLHEEHAGTALSFPFKEATGTDLESAEILINVDQHTPSWWVWVTDDMVPSTIEERSEIDNESYVIISEEHVVDGVANFMARCILSNPRAQYISPKELQNAMSEALGTMNKFDKMFHIWNAGKMFYTLATWGITIAGIYNSRHVLKFAAKGIHYTGKTVMKIL
uniref:Uncharacterized protein n=1 Tax=Kalanchoe fedtschenkoi TaxID=63787 RepID=A0A7N1A1U4_KALFE